MVLSLETTIRFCIKDKQLHKLLFHWGFIYVDTWSFNLFLYYYSVGWKECLCSFLFWREGQEQNSQDMWSFWCKSLPVQWGPKQASSSNYWGMYLNSTLLEVKKQEVSKNLYSLAYILRELSWKFEYWVWRVKCSECCGS